MKRNCVLLLAMLCTTGMFTSAANAAVPLLLSHQGRLLDASDQPVTGSRDITFHIYGDSTGGLPLWTESHLAVPIDNGLFHVTLGGSVTLSADLLANTGPGAFDPTKWLVLQIEGAELLPRMRLGSVPYAVMSSRVSGDVETLPGALTVKGMSGSTTGTIRMQATGDSAIFGSVLDVDGDDVPDVGSGSEALVPRNILKSFFQTGDFPTQAQFTTQSGSSSMDLNCLEIDEEHTASVSADSTGAELKFKNGPILGGMSGSTTGTIRVGHGGGGGGGIGGDAFTVTGIFQDGTSEDVTEMKTARKDITINLRHHDLTGVEGDQTADVAVDSGGSELRLGSGPLSGMSGSTTGTIRVGVVDGGPGGFQQQYTAIGRYSDGNTESSTEQVSNATGAGSRLKGMSGSTTGTIRMMATADSVGNYLDHDDDGDGFAQSRYIMRSGTMGSSSTLTFDTDDNGIADHEILDHVDVDLASSRWKSGPSGSTTGTIRMMATADSVDREMTFDDPLTGASMKVKEKGSRTKCSSNLRFMNPTDSSDVLMECDATSARHALSGMSGSTTGTIRMAASSDSAGTVCEWVQDDTPDGETVYATTWCDSTGTVSTWSQNDDADDFPNIKVRVELKDEFGNSRGGMYLDQDSDNDGVSDTEAELSCDESGARSILSGMSGSTTGTIRMAASPDSAVFDLGISGSTTGTIRIQTSSSGVANPIEHSSGAHLTVGGDWTNASDKDLKENFTKIDGEELLEKIEELPITQWNYKNEDESITHIGPTAQDFQKTFGVGSKEKAISTIDPSGIALAAIKELIKQNQELIKANEELNKRVKALEKKQKKE